MIKENIMRQIRIEKITLNIGTGATPENVKKGFNLLEKISGKKPVQSYAKKRIATWKLRPGLPIGAKVTVRGKAAESLLKNLLSAIDSLVPKKKFGENGFSFGVPEYIDIPGIKYDPKIGVIGLNISVTLERLGYRIKRRKLHPVTIRTTHRVTKEDAMAFAKAKLGVKFNE